ncbi:unnamed protein product [Phaeothamnion confervicola]
MASMLSTSFRRLAIASSHHGPLAGMAALRARECLVLAKAVHSSPSAPAEPLETRLTAALSEPIREGMRSNVHFRLTPQKHPLGIEKRDIQKEKREQEWVVDSVWTQDEVESIRVTHKPPTDLADKVAYYSARGAKFLFDCVAGFKTGVIDEHKYLNRIIFLETVAAVPGMVAGTVRHLRSLRIMKRDHGWIHTLLEEAENERMHLLTFLKLKRPGPMFRLFVLLAQGVMWNGFFFTYLVSPRSCHRFVGYVEEEAVNTYTTLLADIDAGKLPLFENLDAPAIGKSYWSLAPDAKFRDLILAVRADEANHREVSLDPCLFFTDYVAEGNLVGCASFSRPAKMEP